mgnify:CR=1 FL=1
MFQVLGLGFHDDILPQHPTTLQQNRGIFLLPKIWFFGKMKLNRKNTKRNGISRR